VSAGATATDACTLAIMSALKGVEGLQSAIKACYKPLLRTRSRSRSMVTLAPRPRRSSTTAQAKIGAPADDVYRPLTGAKLEFFDEAASRCSTFGK
jgi:hypothetical protein